nr:hypothetical protein Iba_chr03cCG13530 [Ipomoea batatas]GMC76016.1 hypothetical protein Iba_chr03dCG10290 [Ipomoea batatas]GMC77449.1 hypothetical protein Iba_chr03eCG10810 [Ipomoea batatas]
MFPTSNIHCTFGIGKHCKSEITGCCHFLGRRLISADQGDEKITFTLCPIPNCHITSATSKILRHWGTHDSKAQKANTFWRLICQCLRRESLEGDEELRFG